MKQKTPAPDPDLEWLLKARSEIQHTPGFGCIIGVMKCRFALTIAAAFVACSVIGVRAQRVVAEMTPQLIAEAIAAGERGNVASGQLTQSSGFSWGSIHIATFSTPFMRVAAAARQAKRTYKKFTPEQVTPEMVALELHVYAWSQGLSEHGPAAANVTAVVITPRKGHEEQKAAKAHSSHEIRGDPDGVSESVWREG